MKYKDGIKNTQEIIKELTIFQRSILLMEKKYSKEIANELIKLL